MQTVKDITDLEIPSYIIDSDKLHDRYDEIESSFSNVFDDVIVGYSYKTNYIPALLEELHHAGASAEVVSPLEYQLAMNISADVDPVIVNGPNKSRRYLREVIGSDVILNLDSLKEVELAVAASRNVNPVADVGLRINIPHMDHTGPRRASRFGLTLSALEEAVKRIEQSKLSIGGLHVHVSTKQRNLDELGKTLTYLGKASKLVDREALNYVDIGGGFGRAHPEMDFDFPSFKQYAEKAKKELNKYNLSQKQVIIEPGIAMVSDSMSFLTSVQDIKQIDGVSVVFIDGSYSNVKPSGHNRNLPTTVLNENLTPKSTDSKNSYDIVGYTCLEHDYIAKNQQLSQLQCGDVLRVMNVGAYTIVHETPFIKARPPIYLRKGHSYTRVRQSESFEDFFDLYYL
ncbi:diaminopimelate decarboxylase [Salinibacter ruber]|uniref:hypothetical protein n=1 Tax=Salinibacter ruber TaxID=146919 RepID=UPI0021682D84|nr:hypothetical protein [Salinibacter ruber]MCS3632508.1 diaminopimelate decarboxylase [Salinibacter ruber]